MLTGIDGDVCSYGEMDARAAKMAGTFIAMGAQPGDRILVQVEKSTENVAAYLGAIRAGLVYVPLNTAYTDEEVVYFLKDADPAIVICDPARASTFTSLAAPSCHVLTLSADGTGSLGDAADGAAIYNDIAKRRRDDPAAILYTSGTTGRSKGAVLSHGALASNAATLKELWGFTSKDRLLHALPIFHIHGLFVALHVAILSGAEILFLSKFDISEILYALPRASVMMGVPTFYARLLGEEEFTRESAAHMRLFISGSAPLTESLFDAFTKRTGMKILERYGMSEAGMIASNPLDGDRVAGTVGFPLPGVELRITDDDGNMLAHNEPGNVEIKSPALFSTYWQMPEKTKETFRGDWFVTGDIGSLDRAGRLSLSGRSKDLIIAGGYNIYPKEVEAVLDSTVGVSESAVIGVAHRDMGEGVVAVLVAENNQPHEKTGDEEAALTTSLQSLAKFKRPRKFFWVDALPRNAMGKVQKQVLRDRYADIFSNPDSGQSSC